MKKYIENRHTPSGPDDPAKLQSMTVFQRANYWLNTQPIGLALQRTFDLFQKRINHNILFVRYEDLCNKLEETMNNIYCYLQIEPFTHNFSNIVKKVEENSKLFWYLWRSFYKTTIRKNRHKLLERNI